MREPDLDALRERLLEAGVAPHHVRRTICELQDHHTDLFAEAFSRGCSFEDAEREASTRLGTEDSLVYQILARPELRSWSHRWPSIAYGMGPTFLLVLAYVALPIVLGVTDAVRIDQRTFSERWGSPAALWTWSGAIRSLYSFMLPLMMAAGCCLLAWRHRAALRWPLVGVILASIVGAAFQFNVAWPHGPDANGALSVRLSVPPFPGSGGTMLRAVATCALTLGPYLWWRKRATSARHAEGDRESIPL